MSVCTFSIVSINTFSKLCSSFSPWEQDDRHDVTIRIDGQDIPMRYDTGAAATCLTLKTFQKHFSHTKCSNHRTNVIGAGNNDLMLYGASTLPASYKNPKALGTFLVCEHLDDDILGIDLINDLGETPSPSKSSPFRTSKINRLPPMKRPLLCSTRS